MEKKISSDSKRVRDSDKRPVLEKYETSSSSRPRRNLPGGAGVSCGGAGVGVYRPVSRAQLRKKTDNIIQVLSPDEDDISQTRRKDSRRVPDDTEDQSSELSGSNNNSVNCCYPLGPRSGPPKYRPFVGRMEQLQSPSDDECEEDEEPISKSRNFHSKKNIQSHPRHRPGSDDDTDDDIVDETVQSRYRSTHSKGRVPPRQIHSDDEGEAHQVDSDYDGDNEGDEYEFELIYEIGKQYRKIPEKYLTNCRRVNSYGDFISPRPSSDEFSNEMTDDEYTPVNPAFKDRNRVDNWTQMSHRDRNEDGVRSQDRDDASSVETEMMRLVEESGDEFDPVSSVDNSVESPGGGGECDRSNSGTVCIHAREDDDGVNRNKRGARVAAKDVGIAKTAKNGKMVKTAKNGKMVKTAKNAGIAKTAKDVGIGDDNDDTVSLSDDSQPRRSVASGAVSVECPDLTPSARRLKCKSEPPPSPTTKIRHDLAMLKNEFIRLQDYVTDVVAGAPFPVEQTADDDAVSDRDEDREEDVPIDENESEDTVQFSNEDFLNEHLPELYEDGGLLPTLDRRYVADPVDENGNMIDYMGPCTVVEDPIHGRYYFKTPSGLEINILRPTPNETAVHVNCPGNPQYLITVTAEGINNRRYDDDDYSPESEEYLGAGQGDWDVISNRPRNYSDP